MQKKKSRIKEKTFRKDNKGLQPKSVACVKDIGTYCGMEVGVFYKFLRLQDSEVKSNMAILKTKFFLNELKN